MTREQFFVFMDRLDVMWGSKMMGMDEKRLAGWWSALEPFHHVDVHQAFDKAIRTLDAEHLVWPISLPMLLKFTWPIARERDGFTLSLENLIAHYVAEGDTAGQHRAEQKLAHMLSDEGRARL